MNLRRGSLLSYSADMARYGTFDRLGRYAEDQWGLVTRRQAELAGISRATIQRLASEGVLERFAHGVYHLRGAPLPDHPHLRAAWLQLAPEVPAWERTPDQGVVSHRSAALLYGLSELPADRFDFTLPRRRQTRQTAIRLHKRPLANGEWITLRGMPVTRPSRIAADLLEDSEDPAAVARLIAESTRAVYDYPATFARALAPFASRFGLRRGDGLGLLRWLLEMVGDPDTPRWLEAARADAAQSSRPASRDALHRTGVREGTP